MEKSDFGDDYFASYVNEEVHRLMLKDKPRTESYRDAIFKNSAFFEGKVVMDIGAGTGILSLFCWKAGAKAVIAVEASETVHILREIVDKNQAQEVIQVLHGRAEDLELPENVHVDVIISEWMGFYLLHESMLNSVIKARDKFLGEDGVILPSHAKVYAAGYAVDEELENDLKFWNEVYGFDMSPMQKLRLQAHKPQIRLLDSSKLVCEPQVLAEFDLRWVEESEITSMKKRQFVSTTCDANLHGISIWFDCDFSPYDEKWVENVTLSTSPDSNPTHWKQTLIPLPLFIPVETDEIIGWDLHLKQSDSNPRHYDIQLEMLDPAKDEHPEQCPCRMAKCELLNALIEKEQKSLLEAL